MPIWNAGTETLTEDITLIGFDWGIGFGMENMFSEDGEDLEAMEEPDYGKYNAAEEDLEEVNDLDDLLGE